MIYDCCESIQAWLGNHAPFLIHSRVPQLTYLICFQQILVKVMLLSFIAKLAKVAPVS